MRRLAAIPHLFAKGIICFCVLFGAGCSLYALRILSRTGYDPAALLGVILAFFGGELLLLCLKTVLAEKEKARADPGGKEDICEKH